MLFIPHFLSRNITLLFLILFITFMPWEIKAQSDLDPLMITLGEEETVFQYKTDSYGYLDLPDVYAHAIRTPDGIVLTSGNAPDNYFMFGDDFENLSRSCDPVFISADHWEAETLKHQEWITSVYSEDGITIHVLVHNEYHDPFAENCKPGITDPSNPCWYNFLSYAVSHDGGRTFTRPESPDHLVAILPFKWDPDAVERGIPPPHGYFEPSNIVFHDGYYYSLLFAILSNTNQSVRGTCLMRTQTIDVPGSWRFWDGEDFSIPMVNPYSEQIPDSSAYLPAFISKPEIRDLRGSLTWNGYLEKFMLIGSGIHPVEGEETCGFFLSLSDDLIQWSTPQLIFETIFGWPPCHRPTPEQAEKHIRQEAYPSLIDHDAPDISFTGADSTAFLYFMRNMDNFGPSGWGFRRDLIRIPIQFIKDASTHTNHPVATKDLNWQMYPNPAGQQTVISIDYFAEKAAKLSVIDVYGRVVYHQSLQHVNMGSFQVELDLSSFPAGMYWVRIEGDSQQVTGKLLVVK